MLQGSQPQPPMSRPQQPASTPHSATTSRDVIPLRMIPSVMDDSARGGPPRARVSSLSARRAHGHPWGRRSPARAREAAKCSHALRPTSAKFRARDLIKALRWALEGILPRPAGTMGNLRARPGVPSGHGRPCGPRTFPMEHLVEQFARRLVRHDGWTWLGGLDEGKDLECVLRSFDADVRFAEAATREALPAPDAGVIVPAGSGSRLVGHHFFARPVATRGAPPRISVRGLPDDARAASDTRAAQAS